MIFPNTPINKSINLRRVNIIIYETGYSNAFPNPFFAFCEPAGTFVAYFFSFRYGEYIFKGGCILSVRKTVL